MHNNQEYLKYLNQAALKEGIKDIAIIKKSGIGTRLIGGTSDIIFTRGSMNNAYDKAFVAAVKDEEKTKHFLDIIEADTYLEHLNMQDRGFVCAVPFHYIKNFELETPIIKNKEVKMNISQFLKENRILLNLEASNKKDAISELAAVLGNSKEVSDFKLFLNDVFQREALNTTAIGNEIAIPHARTDGVKEFVMAIARVKRGIDFVALDNKPVKLIFLMGTPKEKGVNDYLQKLAHLTRLLQKESFRNSLIRVSSAKEIIEEFRKVEDV